ncbi:Acetoacetyl-CoA synthetase [Lemmus lemmus]
MCHQHLVNEPIASDGCSAQMDEQNSCRSDGTLNPNRVHFGSSEMYNIGSCMSPAILTWVQGGSTSTRTLVPKELYNRDGEERVVLFLKMVSGHTFQPDLVKCIPDAIRLGLSARHVPSLILETRGIPYTLNGKKVEVVVQQVMAGRAVEHLGSPTLRPWTFTRRSLSGRTSESLAQTPSSRACDGT